MFLQKQKTARYNKLFMFSSLYSLKLDFDGKISNKINSVDV